MTELERMALWIALITGVVGAFANIAQVVIQWFQLRELGDLDKDKEDWFEHAPWRHYNKKE